MNEISVIIITRNEQAKIKECLESVKWADEIIVVDDMSTDGTRDICREHKNLKLYERKLDGFGSQKNFALSEASNKWILSVDADEVVTPELKEEILTVIEKETFDGYRLKLNNYIFGKWIQDYKSLNLRLFRRGKGKFTSKKVHETVIVDGKIGELDNILLHRSWSGESVSNYMKDHVNFYSSYTADDLYEMGRRVTIVNSVFYFVLKPILIFFQKYFLKEGFMGGWQGFLLSVFSAVTYFKSYAKLLRKQKNT
ncbi:MAG: glycosyltransferase family 2 protein [Candidatus Omnitrophica bacterium]|nr:glycosyltransferase family 2 protein [Candidatus Omnitrophota bacterium]